MYEALSYFLPSACVFEQKGWAKGYEYRGLVYSYDML